MIVTNRLRQYIYFMKGGDCHASFRFRKNTKVLFLRYYGNVRTRDDLAAGRFADRR